LACRDREIEVRESLALEFSKEWIGEGVIDVFDPALALPVPVNSGRQLGDPVHGHLPGVALIGQLNQETFRKVNYLADSAVKMVGAVRFELTTF
jgi:hypothetical protein